MAIKPNSTPKATIEEISKLVSLPAGGVSLVGVRGYYKDSMGVPGRNDRGIYDDGMFICSPDAFVSFNCNTDAQSYKPHIANLKPGVWTYKLGIHGLSKPASQRYKALVQGDEVTVVRDEEGDDTGYFGINIHRGGLNSVSSLGCQTIYPTQWESFITLVESLMKRYGQKSLKYYLVENK